MKRAWVYRLPQPEERVGQYRVVGPLGRGGQGHVFLAEWEGRSYVLKFFRSLPVSHSGELELDILRHLEHPNVVRVLGHGRWPFPEEGYFYLVMEYVRGRTLLGHALEHNPSARGGATLMLEAARALAVVHRQGVLHRDIKPDNLLVREADGKPVWVDFGVGHLEGRATLPRPWRLPPGTPEYIPARCPGRRRGRCCAAQVAKLGSKWKNLARLFNDLEQSGLFTRYPRMKEFIEEMVRTTPAQVLYGKGQVLRLNGRVTLSVKKAALRPKNGPKYLANLSRHLSSALAEHRSLSVLPGDGEDLIKPGHVASQGPDRVLRHGGFIDVLEVKAFGKVGLSHIGHWIVKRPDSENPGKFIYEFRGDRLERHLRTAEQPPPQ